MPFGPLMEGNTNAIMECDVLHRAEQLSDAPPQKGKRTGRLTEAEKLAGVGSEQPSARSRKRNLFKSSLLVFEFAQR